jgi:hypothetical protein
MTTKAQHLIAIIAMRTVWSGQDRIQAGELARMRYKLERERARANKEPATVPTAAGSVKANPVFSVIDRLATQERQLTRRLQLGAARNAAGRYGAAQSPLETRRTLWEHWGEHCKANLMPGLWFHHVKTAGVDIPEDSVGWPDNPSSLPTVTGLAKTWRTS